MPVYPPKGSTTPKLPLVVPPDGGNGAVKYTLDHLGTFIAEAYSIDTNGDNVRTQYIQLPEGAEKLYAWVKSESGGVINDIDVTPATMGGGNEEAHDNHAYGDPAFVIAQVTPFLSKIELSSSVDLIGSLVAGELFACALELRENIAANGLGVLCFVLE